ncbi:hypothetical protein FGIG_05404 [Fasciola gigantica]|uniref:Uncharacterized protein n=1 Tax=Fasciola gigantica TaxID=46835 RepID=A0A504YCZ5_FASGI|nr:hypothetical protein FGIG_05404 [Fasciola gigantica]
MEDVLWKFVVPLYPVHYNRVARTILKYVSSQLNKFVPDLSGLLLEYDKKSLRISSSMDVSYFDRPIYSSHAHTIVSLKPELRNVNIRAQIQARIFSPRSGLELIGTVSTVQPHLVFCKTEINNVMIAIPRCGDTGMCEVESTVKNNTEGEQTILDVGDVVRIRLSSVTRQLGSFVLRGELISVISRAAAAPQSVLEKFGSGSSDENESEINDTIVRAKKEKSQEKTTPKVTVKTDGEGVALCMPEEPPSPVIKFRKRRRSSSVNSVDPEVPVACPVKIEPPDSSPAGKKIKSDQPIITAEMFAPFSPQVIRTDDHHKASVSKRSKPHKKVVKQDEF